MPGRLTAAVLGILACLAALPATAAEDYASPRRLYGALATQPRERIEVAGGLIDVVFADGAPGLDRGLALDWIRTSAVAVSTYFGRFPVKRVGLLVIAVEGERVTTGTTYGFEGSAIRVLVGRDATAATFKADWVLVHEMTHLALPQMAERFLWILEGSAVYVEPVARAQAGQIPPANVWHDSLRGMPRGLPEAGDKGLDHTPTWGRTYWGGAIFCLLADIAIRQQTDGRFSLQDAFRAINRASGGNEAYWTMDQLIAAGDGATGTAVLATLYAAMKATPVVTDLPALFASLGVSAVDDKVILDDTARLAAIRREITAAPPPIP